MLFSVNKKSLRNFLTACCVLGTTVAQAQYSKPLLSTEGQDVGFQYSQSEIKRTPMVSSLDITNVPSTFNPVLEHIGIYHEEENIPTAKFRKTDTPSPNYVEDRPVGSSLGKDNTAPVIVSSFQGYNDNNYTPPDNSVAIAPNGYIVSAMNSNYRIFKSDGKPVSYSSYHDLLKLSMPSLKGVAFDPRVIYDPQADRFIMVVLYGNVPDSSRILVFFSKSNDPTKGWNFYSLSGNPFNSSEWTDYPNIGVSNDELFITGNLFNANQNPTRPCIWQINKNEGFSGAATLDFKLWTNLKNAAGYSAFTLVPAPFGQKGDIGPGMFFVSNDLYSGNSVRLFDLTGNMNTTGVKIVSYTITYPNQLYYTSPQISPMKGSIKYLNAGDSRIKQAFILGNTIHYVFASQNSTTQNSDIVYARLDVQKKQLDFRSLGLKGFQYSYPALVSSGDTLTDPSVMIGYLRAGSSIYPEIDAVSCDSAFEFSPSVVIKAGFSAIGIQQDQVQRWGDYTGIAREYNGTNRCIFAGAYGSAGSWNTLISEVGSATATSIAQQQAENETTATNIFPNPVQDIYNVQFNLRREAPVTISLYDMQGRIVDVLYSGQTEEGAKKFVFNKAGLSPGIYLLQIKTDKKEITSKRIVVE